MSDQRGLIIVFGSEKGGAGKSTLAINSAVEMQRRGYKVLIIDADKQRTSSKWADRREQECTENGKDWAVVQCVEKIGKIKHVVLEMAKHFDVVIVDPAGRDSAELRSAMLAADMIFVPTQVSQFDLETLDDISELRSEISEYNELLKMFIVLTQAPTNFGGRELKEARGYLGDFAEVMPICSTVIKSRKAYRVSPRSGAGVVEMQDSNAKAEIQLFVQEVIDYAK